MIALDKYNFSWSKRVLLKKIWAVCVVMGLANSNAVAFDENVVLDLKEIHDSSEVRSDNRTDEKNGLTAAVASGVKTALLKIGSTTDSLQQSFEQVGLEKYTKAQNMTVLPVAALLYWFKIEGHYALFREAKHFDFKTSKAREMRRFFGLGGLLALNGYVVHDLWSRHKDIGSKDIDSPETAYQHMLGLQNASYLHRYIQFQNYVMFPAIWLACLVRTMEHNKTGQCSWHFKNPYQKRFAGLAGLLALNGVAVSHLMDLKEDKVSE